MHLCQLLSSIASKYLTTHSQSKTIVAKRPVVIEKNTHRQVRVCHIRHPSLTPNSPIPTINPEPSEF